MELLNTIGNFLAQALQIGICVFIIIWGIAVNVQAIAEWKKNFTNN